MSNKDTALTHIKRCDELFDGNTIRPDKEFAYNQMRLLALELLEIVLEYEKIYGVIQDR